MESCSCSFLINIEAKSMGPELTTRDTVYPKKYAHGFCFAKSNDCPSASKATLMNMDKYFTWIHYERLHNHNKAKHNKTVCIFLGIYCSQQGSWFLLCVCKLSWTKYQCILWGITFSYKSIPPETILRNSAGGIRQPEIDEWDVTENFIFFDLLYFLSFRLGDKATWCSSNWFVNRIDVICII